MWKLRKRNTQYATQASECAIGSDHEGEEVCSNELQMKAMRLYAQAGPNDSKSIVLKKAEKRAGVKSESELYNNAAFQTKLRCFFPNFDPNTTLQQLFTTPGPFNSKAPLSDSNELGVLRQWTKLSRQNAFYPFPYELLDFITIDDSQLRFFDWIRALKQGYRTFALLINTATFDQVQQCKPGQSCGLHWFCLFFDFRALPPTVDFDQLAHAKTPFTQCCTVEFYNSSGNPPRPVIVQYFQQLNRYFETHLPGINLWFITASLARQQFDSYNCGVYCLHYIYNRLQSRSFTYFLTTHITSDEIQSFRTQIFRHDRHYKD